MEGAQQQKRPDRSGLHRRTVLSIVCGSGDEAYQKIRVSGLKCVVNTIAGTTKKPIDFLTDDHGRSGRVKRRYRIHCPPRWSKIS